MNKNTVRVGLIGHQFMGKVHSHAYRDLPFYFDPPVAPVQQAIAGRNEHAVKEAADHFGWASWETDWRRLVERDDIDLIDIVTPNHTHAEMAIAAAESGKHVICEKPLAVTAAEAGRMKKAVEKNNVVHMVSHNYRYAPAVQYAAKLIREGRIGRIYHIRAQYLQDFIMDPEFPLVWRLKKEHTGSGALGDIGAHIIDLARFLVGEFQSVSGMLETFITERPLEDRTGTGEVTVDDASGFLARFDNGAMGVFEATRFAGGNRNKNKFEINGEKGSIRWDLENMNNLEVYFEDDEPGLQGFRMIHCTEDEHPYMKAYWPAGHIIGYEHTFINQMAALMNGIHLKESPHADFADGYENQVVLEAVQQSAASGQWVTTKEIKAAAAADE
ncbi:Gfo/Idh/MocA family protein [Salibacterium sp. K-3]